MTSVKLSRLAAAVLAILLALSCLALPAFAEDVITSAESGASGSAAEQTEAEGENTQAAEGETTQAAVGETTQQTATTGTTTTEKKDFNWDLWISVGVIGLAIVVLLCLYAFSKKFRERVKRFFREYKSELKKVVWSPWNDVKRNTVVVLVISLGAAILIGVLDFVFSKGIIALGTLIGK
jgi:preprotein translocase subunit SecE